MPVFSREEGQLASDFVGYNYLAIFGLEGLDFRFSANDIGVITYLATLYMISALSHDRVKCCGLSPSHDDRKCHRGHVNYVAFPVSTEHK